MINQLQQALKAKEVKRAALLKGYSPSVSEVEEKVSEHFDVYTPGLPTFKVLKQEHRQTSNKTRYDEGFRLLEDDLNVAYLANTANNEALLELEERGQLERTGLLARVNQLRLHLNQLLKDEVSLKVIGADHFSNFYQVDFIGNTVRNLPPTSCFVDLGNHQVTLPRRSLLSSRAYLGESKIQIHSSSIKESKGSVESLLKDTVNESYHLTTYHSSLSLTVLFKEAIELNTIEFDFISSVDMLGYVELMMEDGTTETFYSLTSTEHFKWSCSKRLVRSLVLTLDKTKAEGYDETGALVYYFLLKRLSVSVQSYESQATFISKKITVNELPLSIQLETSASLFEQTGIEYFIGFDNDLDKIHWQRLTPQVPTSLGLTNQTHKVISQNEVVLPVDVIPSTIHVTPFYQQLKLESYTLSDDYLYKTVVEEETVIDPETEEEVTIETTRLELQVNLDTLQIDEALRNCTHQEVSYLALDDYLKTLKPNTFYVMTQYVEAEEACMLSDLQISGVTDYRLFVNGTEVHIGSESFSLPLKAGINKVQLAFLTVNKVEKTYREHPMVLMHNINFKALSSDLYATTPYSFSQEVTDKEGYFYLEGETLKINAPEAGPHFIRYETLKESAKSNLTQTLNGYQAHLRFMAVLKSENEDFSPILHHYQVISC